MAGNLRFDVHDANGDLLVTLDNAFDKEAKAERNGAGYMKFSIARDDAAVTTVNLAQGNTVRVYNEDADTDNACIEAFLLSGDFDLISKDEQGGQNLHFSGPGTLFYLDRARLDYVQYLGTTQLVFLEEGVWRWNTETEGNIIRRMIDEAQNEDHSDEGIIRTGGFRPSDPIPLVTRSFDAAVDTDGTSWGDEALEGNYEAPIGGSVYDEVLRFAGMGFIQVEMQPGYILDARRSDREDSGKTGDDFGAGVILFQAGINIGNEVQRRAPGKVYASDAIIRGNDNVYARANVAGPDGWVQEVFVEIPSDTVATLERGAEGMLGFAQDAQDSVAIEPKLPRAGFPADEDTGVYVPGPHWTTGGMYWTGDRVTLDTGSSEFDYDHEPLYVNGVTLSEDATGAVQAIVELGPIAGVDPFQSASLREPCDTCPCTPGEAVDDTDPIAYLGEMYVGGVNVTLTGSGTETVPFVDQTNDTRMQFVPGTAFVIFANGTVGVGVEEPTFGRVQVTSAPSGDARVVARVNCDPDPAGEG